MSTRRAQTAACLGLAVLTLLLAGPTAVASTPGGTMAADEPVPPGDDVVTSTVSAGIVQPLVVVMDLSSSMLEDDGSGTIKLDGAKAALSSLMRRQPSGSVIGLWTYPSPFDECDPGGFVPGAEVGPVSDPSALSATIGALVAGGNTPTGTALLSVVESLKARNLSSATILLVSDGESNCELPPCDVAQDIVDEGFDITVEAMGFRISDQGREELECIAAATEGSYYDVEDSDQLAERLDEIAVPALELTVTASTSVAAGMATTIRAEVTNPSAQTTSDVSVSLVFTDAGSRTVFPAVVPPRFRLGNLPGGQTLVREWMVSSVGIADGVANWRVTAWSPDGGAASQTGTIEIRDAAATIDDAGPILSDLGPGRLVILGDSYSSGEGAGSYQVDTQGVDELCHRSDLTYGTGLFPDGAEIIACSSAVTENLTAPQSGRADQGQLAQLAGLDEPPSLVLMTIGGNDIGFGNIVTRCVYSDVKIGPIPLPSGADCSDDDEWVADAFWRIATLGPALERGYKQVWDAVNQPDDVQTRGGAVAPVVILAYPQVLPEWQRGSCGGFEAGEIKFGNEVVAALDDAVAHAVANVQQQGYSVYYAGQVHGAVLPNHTACAEEPYVNNLEVFEGYGAGFAEATGEKGRVQELMHPNERGYAAITQALVAWSQTAEPVAQAAPRAQRVTTAPSVSVDMTEAGPDASVRVSAGEPVDLTLTGLAPGTTVTVTVRSTPRAVGSLMADADGVARGVVYVPSDLPAGQHTLVASGLDADLAFVEDAIGLTVLPARPAWYWPAVGLCAAALAGAAWLVLRGRRLLRVPAAATSSDKA